MWKIGQKHSSVCWFASQQNPSLGQLVAVWPQQTPGLPEMGRGDMDTWIRFLPASSLQNPNLLVWWLSLRVVCFNLSTWRCYFYSSIGTSVARPLPRLWRLQPSLASGREHQVPPFLEFLPIDVHPGFSWPCIPRTSCLGAYWGLPVNCNLSDTKMAPFIVTTQDTESIILVH